MTHASVMVDNEEVSHLKERIMELEREQALREEEMKKVIL